MNLKPIPQTRLSILLPVFQARIVEAGLQEVTPEHLLDKLRVGYENRFAGAYADDFDNPKHVLIMTHLPSTLGEKTIGFINLIWTHPSERGTIDTEIFFRTAEQYARFHGAVALCGSAWKLGSAKDTDALWLSKGFQQQEVVYFRNLTSE
jgi:hypothetical protein